jgi:hypothetical protein
MKRKIKWVVLSVIVLIVGFHLARMAMFHFEPASFSQVPQHGQAFGGPELHKGGVGHFAKQHHSMMRGNQEILRSGQNGLMGESRMIVGNILSLLLPLVMIILGWILFKLGKKNKTKKTIGAILMFIGLWAFLPKWLMFLGLLGVGYYFYKTKKAPTFSAVGLSEQATAPSPKYDFLDEWERMINKEEKNNGNL